MTTAPAAAEPSPEAVLSFAPARLLSLPNGDVGVMAERSTGWCVLTAREYEHLRSFMQAPRRLVDLPGGDVDVLRSLWDAGLLMADGLPNPATANPLPEWPDVLLLKLTGACNFDCTYCYDYDEKRFSARLGVDRIMETVRSLLAVRPGLSIAFHGGEPLLRFSVIREVVARLLDEAGREHVRFAIQTNGSRFTDEVVAFLEEHDFSVGISLDGASDEANLLRPARRGRSAFACVEDLLARWPDFVKQRCGFLAVASRTSLPTLPEFALWLQAEEITGLSISFLDAAGRGRDLPDEMLTPDEGVALYTTFVSMIRDGTLDRLAFRNLISRMANLFTFRPRDLCHKGPCGAAGQFLVLDAEGAMRTCDCVYDPYFVLGDAQSRVADSSHPVRVQLTTRHERLRDEGPTCATCPLFGLCGGTCVAKAIARTGSSDAVDPVECAVVRYLYPELLAEFAGSEPRPLFDYYFRHTQ